jgi:hypothetical protein
MTNPWQPESRGMLTVHTVSASELNVRLALVFGNSLV